MWPKRLHVWLIVKQFPIKPGWLNDPFVLWDISQNNQSIFDLSSPVIVKIWTNYNEISTAQHENLARSSLKSPQSKNLDCSKWKSGSSNMKSWPFSRKILIVQQETLDRSTWNLDRSAGKSWPFKIKIWTVQHEIMAVQHETSTVEHEISIFEQNIVPYKENFGCSNSPRVAFYNSIHNKVKYT